MSNTIYESNNKDAKYIKSSVNNNKSKVLICYSIESSDYLKCIKYDINENENPLSEVFFTANYCNTKAFGFNIYYFNEVDEYIISCINNEKSKISMIRIDSNFNLIDNNDNTFTEKSFSNCYTLDFFSIIFISQYQQFSPMIQSNCGGQKYIRIFMLSKSV